MLPNFGFHCPVLFDAIASGQPCDDMEWSRYFVEDVGGLLILLGLVHQDQGVVGYHLPDT